MLIAPFVSLPYVPQSSAVRFAAKAREMLRSSIGDSGKLTGDAGKSGTYIPFARRGLANIWGVDEAERAMPGEVHFVYLVTNKGGRLGAKRVAQRRAGCQNEHVNGYA